MKTDQAKSRNIGTVLVVVGLCVFVLVVGNLVFSFVREHKALDRFVDRHDEATAFIKSVYDFHKRNGAWPSEETSEALKKKVDLQDDWAYYDSLSGSPTLILHGPFHSVLSYEFRVSQDGELNTIWRLMLEGSSREVAATEQYCT